MITALFLEDFGLIVDAMSGGMSSASSTLAARLAPRAVVSGTASPDVTVFQGAEAVQQASADWQAIERGAGAATPFQSVAMARAVASAHLRRGEVPRIVVVRREGRAVVILPTVLTRQFGLTVARFLGDPLIQYGDALCEPGTVKHDIEAAWRAAADPAVAHAVHFRKVRADARIAAVLRDDASASNRDEAPYLDIARASCSTDDEPRQLRRSRRKLASLGALRLDVTQGEDARPHLREALAIKRAWLAARRLPTSVIGDEHWEDTLTQLADNRGAMRLRVAVLNVADKPAAYEVAFTAGDRWYAFIGAVVDEFARHSPGRVQVADTIAYCGSQGFASYDLLAPSDDVKRSYCSDAIAVTDYTRALRPGGYLCAAAARLAPAAKALLVRMPAALRKPILAMAGR